MAAPEKGSHEHARVAMEDAYFEWKESKSGKEARLAIMKAFSAGYTTGIQYAVDLVKDETGNNTTCDPCFGCNLTKYGQLMCKQRKAMPRCPGMIQPKEEP